MGYCIITNYQCSRPWRHNTWLLCTKRVGLNFLKRFPHVLCSTFFSKIAMNGALNTRNKLQWKPVARTMCFFLFNLFQHRWQLKLKSTRVCSFAHELPLPPSPCLMEMISLHRWLACDFANQICKISFLCTYKETQQIPIQYSYLIKHFVVQNVSTKTLLYKDDSCLGLPRKHRQIADAEPVVDHSDPSGSQFSHYCKARDQRWASSLYARKHWADTLNHG